eukprot:1149122-Pelagomonas_calceolata.AAC.3
MQREKEREGQGCKVYPSVGAAQLKMWNEKEREKDECGRKGKRRKEKEREGQKKEARVPLLKVEEQGASSEHHSAYLWREHNRELGY